MITFGCYDNEGKWWTVDEIKNATVSSISLAFHKRLKTQLFIFSKKGSDRANKLCSYSDFILGKFEQNDK